MHKCEKSQKSPNFLREFCVGKPVGYAEILTFGNIFCTFYLTVKKVLQQGYFSSGSPALTYSGLSAPNAPLPPQKPSALHIRIFRHRTPLVSRRNRQTKFLDSHRNHPTPPLQFTGTAEYNPSQLTGADEQNPLPPIRTTKGTPCRLPAKRKTYKPDLPAGTAEGTPRHPQTKEKHTKPNYTPDEKRRQNIGTR